MDLKLPLFTQLLESWEINQQSQASLELDPISTETEEELNPSENDKRTNERVDHAADNQHSPNDFDFSEKNFSEFIFMV